MNPPPPAQGQQPAPPTLAPGGARLFTEAALAEVERIELGPGTCALFSAPCPLDKGPNEDGALVLPLSDAHAVLAVADGVGGLPGGQHAARTALETLSGAITDALTAGATVRDAILDGVDRAHAAVLALGMGAGTTLVVAEVEERRVRSYHVGDSGLLVLGQRGLVRLQTTFHSPVGYAIEAGLLDEREALHHVDRHLLSNALGQEGMHVEIGSPLELQPLDTLLLASDGLFDNLHTDEIAERIRVGPLAASLGALVELCSQRMRGARAGQPSKPDDLTVVAFRPARG